MKNRLKLLVDELEKEVLIKVLADIDRIIAQKEIPEQEEIES